MLDLYAAARTDREGGVHLASILALNPPAHVWEGLRLYASTLHRHIDDMREQALAKAKARR